MQVIAWRTVSEMTYNVSSGTLNLTHSLTHSITVKRYVDNHRTFAKGRRQKLETNNKSNNKINHIKSQKNCKATENIIARETV